MLRKLIPLLALLFIGSASRDFNGTTSYSDSTYTTAFPTSYSVAVYYHPDAIGETAGRFYDKSGEGNAFIRGDGGSGTTESECFGHVFSTTQGQWCATANSMSFNVWYHWVFTYDSSATTNDPLMYRNGGSQSFTETSTPVGTEVDTAATMYIGNSSTAAARTFDGEISHLIFYNRILTATEVRWSYWMPRILPGGIYHLPIWEASGDERDFQAGGEIATTVDMAAKTDSFKYMIGSHIV